MRVLFAVLASLAAATPSRAVMVEPHGRGQVLLFPYYTVQGGQQTLLSIVNHSNTGKALKVRFREGRNGREVFGFNLYLSEFDVWTAALFAAGEGTAARLVTDDTSCTVPGIQASVALPLPRLPDGRRYIEFGTRDFSGPRADAGPADASRTREGYVEVIEMGTLANNSDSDKAATHVGGVPQSCPTLEGAWGPGGYWDAQPTYDLLPPSGQLSGSASIVAVQEGVLYGFEATALDGFSIVIQHTGPGAVLPDLSSAVTDPARRVVESVAVSEGRVYRSRWPQDRAIDAVSAVLMQSTLYNDYLLDPALGARSEWLLSFPTRRHYTDPALVGNQAVPPFTAPFMPNPMCERSNTLLIDREGRRPSGTTSDGRPVPGTLCHATQALSLGFDTAPASLLGSALAEPISLGFGPGLGPAPAGTIQLHLAAYNHRLRPALGGETYDGLPVLATWLHRYSAGSGRTVAAVQPHRGAMQCWDPARASACVSP